LILDNLQKISSGGSQFFAQTASACVHPRLYFFFVMWFLASFSAYAATEAEGVNEVLNINPSARSAGLAGVRLGLSGSTAISTDNPASMRDLDASWVSLQHTEYFLGDQFDYVSAALPLGDNHIFALSYARFSSTDIPWIREGEALPEGDNYRTLSISENVWSFAWASGWKSLDFGSTVHVLRRQLDQSGWGYRVDASARWFPVATWNLGISAEGLTGSGATWASGYTEYTRPEVFVGTGWKKDLPYLYGALELAWQSSSLFNHRARAEDWGSGTLIDTAQTPEYEDEIYGQPIYEDPVEWLVTSALAMEFGFDWGGHLRLGLKNANRLNSWSAGAGLEVFDFAILDYALENHSSLGKVHRLGLSFSPGKWLSRND